MSNEIKVTLNLKPETRSKENPRAINCFIMLQPLSPSASQEHSDVNEALIENHFDSEDGNRTGCRNVRHRQQ